MTGVQTCALPILLSQSCLHNESLVLSMPTDEKMEPVVYIMENRFSYGCEFYGNQIGVAMTAITERCFLAMSQVCLYDVTYITGQLKN